MEFARLLLVLAVHVLKASGDYNVSVFFSSYSNPSHRHHNGGCCEIPWFFGGCLGNCDNYFVVCQGDDNCRHTGEVGDSDTINFDSHVGRLLNPINFTVNGSWTGELEVTVYVYDDDDFFLATLNGDEFIGSFTVTEPTDGLITIGGRTASMTLSVTVSCTRGYYGADCSVWCEPDPVSHWCGSDGRWICVDGWTGEWCDVCRTSSDCSERGGYCEHPDECLCHEGFTGPNCNILVTPSPSELPSNGPPITSNPPLTSNSPTSGPTSPSELPSNGPPITSNPPLTSNSPTSGQTPPTELPSNGPPITSNPPLTSNSPTSGQTPPTELPSTTSRTPSTTILPLTSSPDPPASGPTSSDSLSTGTPTPTTTAAVESQLIPTETSQPQPFVNSDEDDEVGGMIGGVVGGLVVLIVLLVLLILGVWYCLYRQRQRRKQRVDDVRPLVEPLIGENPMYVGHAMGTHTAQQNGQEYHQFTNPLYGLVRSPRSPTGASSSSSPLYAYPTRHSHLLASVYLPGDESPPTASLSSQNNGFSSPSSGQHYEQQPPDRLNDIPSLNAASSRDEGHRTMSISNQYFHLPPDTNID